MTLVRPLSTTVTNVRVDVSLPAGAELTETLQTPNRSVFLSVDGNALSWGAPSYEPGDPVDAFTFRLARPLNGEAHIRGSWEIDGQPRVDEIRAAPRVEVARGAAGEVTLRRGVETDTVGETGVRLGLDPESALDGVTLRVRKLGPEANPPAGVGSPWWCAMLAVEGLPDGASVFVVVPLRQPLPPGSRVELFAERGGAWERLEDQGHATVDGQFVTFRHPGGTVASGVRTTIQPAAVAQPPVGGVVGLPTPTPVGVLQLPTPVREPPKLEVSILGPTAIPSNTSSVHSITVSNVGRGFAERIRVVIFANGRTFASLGLTVTSITGISGGFTCRWPVALTFFGEFEGEGAECTSLSLAAGSSGTILMGSDTPRLYERCGGSLVASVQNNFPGMVSTADAVAFPIHVAKYPSGDC